MADNNPFGFGPGDFDEFAKEAGDQFRAMLGRFVANQGGTGWSNARKDPETTGQAGTGVWAIFVVDEDGGARVEQVFASELDALRANQHNTDDRRKVRFLPYGIAVSALDD